MPAISLKGVSKKYRIYPRQRDRLREVLSFGKKKYSHDFWALKDIDLEVEPGTTMGILGRNGAGKSTLLKIISGVLQPTSGSVEINGRLAALLQLGAGFNPEFTGRENVMLNGLLLGIERREMLEHFDEIAAFADIGEFMEQPVKTYSSGMRARLGFAVAVNVEPDILIVDETLSVGDAIFKHMGLQRMRELRDSGTTIFFVSHSTNMVKNFCTEAVLLHRGGMVVRADTAEVADRYQALISGAQAQRNVRSSTSVTSLDDDIAGEEDGTGSPPEFKENPSLERRSSNIRHGTGEVRILNVELLDDSGAPTEAVDLDSPATVRLHLEYLEEVNGSAANIVFRNKAGLDVFATGTSVEKVRIGKRSKGERVIVDFSLNMPLQPGSYSVTASVSSSQNKELFLDWVDVAATFNIERSEGQGAVRGLIYIPTVVEVHSLDREQQSKFA